MATVLVASHVIRYPMGGFVSYHLHLMLALKRLGHDVYLIERASEPGECWDPVSGRMGDDATSGIRIVAEVLERYGLPGRWSFVDRAGTPFGLPRSRLDALLKRADLLFDVGAHGSWNNLTGGAVRALLDGEPGWTQMRWALKSEAGSAVPKYDAYFTVGQNVGTPDNGIPTLGLPWRSTYYPIVVDLLSVDEPPDGAPFTTVMNWQAHEVLQFHGTEYGQKDREFRRFEELPLKAATPLEVAVAGKPPLDALRASGWTVRDAHAMTLDLGTYWSYVRRSRGEFSVAKHVFVATQSGWFSERSALYLGFGRPVVVQDTGLARHLPVGRGVVTFSNLSDAAAALAEVSGNYDQHASWAREIAREYFDGSRVLPSVLGAVGI